ncbi:MAG TPA: DUF2268 domain-containing putative Zn-dependent protease [Candidatus Cybelea sp.]|jgi:hypothetical protein
MHLVSAMLLAVVIAAAREIPVVDMTGPFFAAIDPQSGQVAQRVDSFKEKLLYPNHELFNEPYFRLDDPHIAWYLQRQEASLANLRAFHASLTESLPRLEDSFERAFPAFDPQTVQLFIMPGFGVFDGMTSVVGGKLALLIGIDNLAQESSAVPVLLTHELFHIYHHEANPAFFVTATENDLYKYGLYRELWAEGLATHVSQALNPGATEAQALFSQSLANLQAADRRRLACLIDKNLSSTDLKTSDLFFDGGIHPDGLPSRGGYYIGYLVAKQLGSRYSLAQLAQLSGDELQRDVSDGVHALCSLAV